MIIPGPSTLLAFVIYLLLSFILPRARSSRRLDFAEAQKEALGCTKCGLCHSRTQVIFGEGR